MVSVHAILNDVVCTYRRDGVRVNTSRFDTGEICTQGELESSELYNNGLGVFIEDGRADIEFCTNGAGTVSCS